MTPRTYLLITPELVLRLRDIEPMLENMNLSSLKHDKIKTFFYRCQKYNTIES